MNTGTVMSLYFIYKLLIVPLLCLYATKGLKVYKLPEITVQVTKHQRELYLVLLQSETTV